MDRIIAAFSNRNTALRVRELVEGAGLANVLVCDAAARVRRVAAVEAITLVVCGFQLPDASAQELFYDLPPSCSMLLIAPQAQLDLCPQPDIFRLPAPVSRWDLLSSVEDLLRLGRGVRPSSKPPRSEDEKAVIAKAKVILMERWGMTEDQAHRFLQKKSMDARVKLSQTAQLIVDTW